MKTNALGKPLAPTTNHHQLSLCGHYCAIGGCKRQSIGPNFNYSSANISEEFSGQKGFILLSV